MQTRYLSKASGAPETNYPFIRGDTSPVGSVHNWIYFNDPDGKGQKYWVFQTDTSQFNIGLAIEYVGFTQQYVSNGAHVEYYTWSQDPVGNAYISATVATDDYANSTQVQKKTTQTLDQYGNVTQSQVFDYGAPGGPPQTTAGRTYTNTYLTNPNYTSRYIFNRLVSSTVTDSAGNTATLTSILYDGSWVDQPGMTMHDSNYGFSFPYRGNPYSISQPGVGKTITYDIGGNVVSTTVNGVYTTVSNTSATNYAAPSQFTMAQLNTTLNWTAALDPSSQTGPNGDSASIAYDSNARPISTTSPYGAGTTYNYQDSLSPPTITTSMNGHGTRITKDGFGRTIKTETGTTTGNPPVMATVLSVVDTVYDSCGCSPIGKLKQVSQPHVPNGTAVFTSYTYDGLGRTLTSVAGDGSTTHYSYAGNTVTVTDPAGKWKKFTMDAFGNLTRVDEQGSAAIATFYTFDVLNHLTQVAMWTSQAVQYRTFNYTSGNTVGGLLLSATNPENGTVTYTYDSNSRLATKQDANLAAYGSHLQYSYDGLNRLTQVARWDPGYPAYNIPPTITTLRTYYYDSNPFDNTGFSHYTSGRLAAVQYAPKNILLTWNDSGGTSATETLTDMFSYSQPGQVTGKGLRLTRTQPLTPGGSATPTVTLSADLDVSYSYNNEGKLTNIAYPATASGAGSSYAYSFDTMMRPVGMTDQNNTSVVSNVQYGAANEVTQITINGGVETRQYNSLHQLTNITGLGQNVTYTFPVGSNNGKISSQTDAISGETVNYQYDSLNRLISAAGSGWSQGFGYDDFGNLTSRTGTNAINTPADPNTNRLTQYAYDANGNMTSTGNGYDVENRLIAVNSGTTQYFYDAQNKRVWTGNFSSPYASATLVSESFAVYGADGKLLGQYSPQFGYDSQGHLISMSFSGGPSRTYFGNRLLTNPQDRLGSIGKYYPYGEERNYPALPNDQVKFATYTRDGVSGLDYADQRYYSSTVGRFMSPDPYQASTCAQGCACSAQRSPGVWNRYTYVTGDPVGFNDPRGLFVQDPDDSNSVNFEFSFYPPELLAALAQNSTPVDSLKLWEVTLGLIVPDASGNFAAFSASTANFGNISYYIEQSPGQFLDLIEQSLQPTPTGTKTLWDVLARAVSAGNPMAVVVTAVLTLLAQPAGGKDEICFEQYEQDSAICRQLHSSACWDQAAQRLGACLAGRPIPPFPYGK